MNEKPKKERYVYWGLTAFIVITAVTGIIFMFINIDSVKAAGTKLINILKPVIYGAVLAYLIAPIYNRVYSFSRAHLEKHFAKREKPAGRKTGLSAASGRKTAEERAEGMAKFFATIAALAVLLAAAAGLIYMMLPELYKSVVNVINSAPSDIRRFSAGIQDLFEGDFEYKNEILALYRSAVEFLQNFLNNTLKPNMDKIIGQVYISVMSVAKWLYNLLIGLIVMIYLLNIKDTLIPQIKKLIYAFLPYDAAKSTVNELKYINSVFGGFIIGKIVDSLIIGVLCFAILSVFQMPYTLLVSVIVGVTNVIPFFGPFIGAIPSFILIVIVDPKMGLYFLIIIILLQQFDGNILGPKILGDKTGISSFWVLFSILLFGGLFGFIGMIIAVPTWAVILNAVKNISSRMLRKKGLSDRTRDYKDQDMDKNI